MGRTHLLVGAGVVLTAALFAGCASKPRAAAPKRTQAPVASSAAPQAAPVRDSGRPRSPAEQPAASSVDVTPTSLAQHAESYAQNLESLLTKRQPNSPANAVAAQVPARQTHSDDDLVAPRRPAATPTAPAGEVPPVANAGMSVDAQSAEADAPPAAVASAPAPVPAPAGARVMAALPKSASTGAAPAPAASPKAASAPATADELQQKYGGRVKQNPRDAAAHLDYQVLQFLRDEPVPELGSIATLPAEDRELLAALLDGLSNFRSGLRAEANMLQSKKVAPLLEMGDRLRSQGELTIPTAALCTRVDAFGVYEPMEPAQFKAGSLNEAVLYCEVANYSSQLNEQKKWETKLKYEGVIYSESGLNVWQDKADTFTDVSRSRRHDFYVVKRMRLPPNLPVGRYLLKLTVTDLQMSRVAESTVPIQVVAQ